MYPKGSIHPSSQDPAARQVNLAPAPLDIPVIHLYHLKCDVPSHNLWKQARDIYVDNK